MNICHIVTGLSRACGTSQYFVNTARAQQAAGHEVTVVTREAEPGMALGDLKVVLTEDPVEWLKRRKEVEKRGGQRNGKTVFHLHSMWNWYVHRVAVWCRGNKVPYVWSPHGSLTPWAMRYHWWKKLLAWWLYQRADLKGAAGFHVTVEEEEQDVRRMGFGQSVVVAPLGSEVGGEEIGGERRWTEEGCDRRDVVFVGRIHPKKNIDGLIKAFARVRGAWLIIAGPDENGYLDVLKRLADRIGLGDDEIVFAGPVYGEEKTKLYRHAWVSVLPSHSENFGGVVVEALAQGTPVVASKGTPWQVLAEKGCGWWVETSVEGIAAGLQAALKISEAEREAMAERARALVSERYSWKASAEKVVELYEEVGGRELALDYISRVTQIA